MKNLYLLLTTMPVPENHEYVASAEKWDAWYWEHSKKTPQKPVFLVDILKDLPVPEKRNQDNRLQFNWRGL